MSQSQREAKIPHTAVWGSFKSFLPRAVTDDDENPPNGSLGIVQVHTIYSRDCQPLN